MILWLVLTWAVVVLLLGPDIWRIRSERRRTNAATHESSTPVQILFAEHAGDTIAVDCVLLEPLEVEDRTLPSGFPMSLHFEPLDDRRLSVAACNVISRWAEEERCVTLRLITGDGPSHARLTDHTTTLQLDLEGAYG